MNRRFLASVVCTSAAITVSLLSATVAAGQTPAASSAKSSGAAAKPSASQAKAAGSLSKKTWTPTRTADGQPDLQGVWTNVTITPLERPVELAGKEFLTEQEAALYEKRTVQANNADRRDLPPEADVGRAYNDAWYDRGTK